MASNTTMVDTSDTPVGTKGNPFYVDTATSVTADVNLAEVGGTATATGSGTVTGALRVEIANNGTGVVGLNKGTNSIGEVTANAGTNLNTSALATQATLAALLASIGAAGDAADAPTVIGQLKQIVINTTA